MLFFKHKIKRIYYLTDSTYSQHLSRPGNCSTVHVQAEMERGKCWEFPRMRDSSFIDDLIECTACSKTFPKILNCENVTIYKQLYRCYFQLCLLVFRNRIYFHHIMDSVTLFGLFPYTNTHNTNIVLLDSLFTRLFSKIRLKEQHFSKYLNLLHQFFNNNK